MIARTTNGIANFGAELNDRLVHLRFELLFERNFSAFEDFVDMRTQLARLRIDDRELLFDSQSERVVLWTHAGSEMSLKTAVLSSQPESRDTVAIIKANTAGSFDFASLRMTGWPTSVPLTDVASRHLAGTCPSLDCPDRERARALCGWPFLKPRPPPTRSCARR